MVKERRTELVQGFRHSVPYINTHRGKTFVIMLGGEAIEHENFSSIVNDIGLLHSLGIRLVVVYGARPQIEANLAAHHHEPIYHKHTRDGCENPRAGQTGGGSVAARYHRPPVDEPE